jgi:two-component system, NarL family, nitrate/nitrite response regulator NarL
MGQMRSKPELRKQSGDAGAGATALTQRERQIVRLVCEGLSNKEVGQRLNITDGTIKVHLHKIFEKLRVSNRTALVAVYLASPDNHGPQDQEGEQPDNE